MFMLIHTFGQKQSCI